MSGLTSQQAELLSFIKSFVKKNDFAPSFVEMTVFMGLASKSGIHRLLSALEERGHIRRLSRRARAIEVVSKSGLAKFSTMDLRRELVRRQTGVANDAPYQL